MPRIPATILVYCFFFATSCSTTQSPFGLSIIDTKAADPALSTNEIARIKSLGNHHFDSATYTDGEAVAIKYRLFTPNQSSNRSIKYPLVIVFHSSGPSIGIDNNSQLGLLAKLFAGASIQSKYPAYVLAPQFPTRSSDYVFDKKRNVLSSSPRVCLKASLHLIDSLKQHLNIDSDRIYAVGFSMGGSTVINSLTARPEIFAAGISISGIPQFDKMKELSTIPLWLIHGLEDTENPISSDEQFYKELDPKNKIRFWKLKETTHDNVFTTLLLGETLPKWLFKQHKK